MEKNKLLVTMITMLLVRPRSDVQVYVPDSCGWMSLIVNRYLVAFSSGPLTFVQSVCMGEEKRERERTKWAFVTGYLWLDLLS